jgi:hypothetical protein
MSNDCRKFRDQIADFVTDVLPEPDSRELQEHLGRCVDCRDYLQALQQEDASLTGYFEGIDEDMACRQERALQMIECSRTKEKRHTIPIWREIMRNRYSRLATAAAILVLAAVALTILDKSTAPAYAITDLPREFKQARIIHLQGWHYFPEHTMPDGRKIPPVEINDWIDVEHSRSRHSGAGLGVDDRGVRVTVSETISDGPYRMSMNHTDRSARYYRVSPYQQKLTTYQMSKLLSGQLFGDIEQLSDSVVVGREQIDGVAYDIWQSDASGFRCKMWLSADFGKLGRAQVLSQVASGRWELQRDYQVIEYNVEVPEGVFSMDPPSGYTTANSQETAVLEELGSGGGVAYEDDQHSLQCDIRMSFTLSDGSVLLGWFSTDRGRGGSTRVNQQKDSDTREWSNADGTSMAPTEASFEGIRFSGPVPQLPVEIYALKPAGGDSGVTYEGHHLAYTHKGDKFIEWSLYIPNGTPPSNVEQLGYEVLYRFNLDPKPMWIIHMTEGYGILIENAKDFDTWILGAMAELSDSGTAPGQVTYQAVLELIQQVRADSKR